MEGLPQEKGKVSIVDKQSKKRIINANADTDSYRTVLSHYR